MTQPDSLIEWLNGHQNHELAYLGPDDGDPAVGMAGHGPEILCEDCQQATPEALWLPPHGGTLGAGLREALERYDSLYVEQDPEDGSWSIELIEVPGHVGAGATLAEAAAAALDAAGALLAASSEEPTAPALDVEDLRALATSVLREWDVLVLSLIPDVCACGDYVPDSSGEAGCGNCGADFEPEYDGVHPAFPSDMARLADAILPLRRLLAARLTSKPAEHEDGEVQP